MKRLVVGIDPGTGLTSPTGLVIFDPDDKSLLLAAQITSKSKDTRIRIKEIAAQVEELLDIIDPDLNVHVFCERFVMRGKGGETLARMTGALMAAVPHEFAFDFVQNTTVKRVVGGHGKADKEQVAAGFLKWSSKETQQQLMKALEAGHWDIFDAAAIGLTGWLLEMNLST